MIAFEEMHSFVNSFGIKEILQRFVVQNLMMNVENAQVLKTTVNSFEKNIYIDYLYMKLKCIMKKEDWIRLSFLSILYFEKKYKFSEKSAFENYNFGMVRLRELLWECFAEIADLPFYQELSQIQELNYIPSAETIKQFSIVDYAESVYNTESMNFISSDATDFIEKPFFSSLPNAMFTDFGIAIEPLDYIKEITEEEFIQWKIGNKTFPWVSKMFAWFKENGMDKNVPETYGNLYQFALYPMNGMNQLSKGGEDPETMSNLILYFAKLLKKIRVFSIKDALNNGVILRKTPIAGSTQIVGVLLNFIHQVEFAKQFCAKYIFKKSSFIGRVNLLLQQAKGPLQNSFGFYGFMHLSEGEVQTKLKQYVGYYGAPFKDLPYDTGNFVELGDFARGKVCFLTFKHNNMIKTRYFMPIDFATIPFNYDTSVSMKISEMKDFLTFSSREISEKFNFLGIADILHSLSLSSDNSLLFYNKIMNLNALLSIGAIYQNMSVEQALIDSPSDLDNNVVQYFKDQELFSSFFSMLKSFDNYKEAV